MPSLAKPSQPNDQMSFTESTASEDSGPGEYDHDGANLHKRAGKEDLHNVRLTWSDDKGKEVGSAAFQKHKARKPEARKRAARSAVRAKRANIKYEAKALAGNTGVGLRMPSKASRKRSRRYDESSSDEDLMEWTMPDYVQTRRAEFNRRTEEMREAGLLLPPRYEDIHFSEDEDLERIKERPNFPSLNPTSQYKDVELPYSRGIIPAPIAQYLRDYQIKGVSFLHENFVYQRGGILGDDMGLGKTVQVIAFLTAAYGKTGDERDANRMRKMRTKDSWYPRTLIICPGSLMANWQDEFQRWGWWHVDLYHGANRDEVLEAASAGMIEVMITTYTTYQMNRGQINMVRWDCVVADECHQVKNRRAEITVAMNELNALCRIGLTGTAIQNKYEELWTLLNWTSPGQLGPISTWRSSISEPLKLGQSHNATGYELAKARSVAKKLVQNLLPRFFLRRMKSLIQDQLPKKTDRVVFCPLTSTQAEAYQSFLDSDIVQFIKNSTKMCSCGSGKKSGWCCNALLEDGSPWQAWVFPALITLQKLSNHLALLIPSGNDTKDKQAKDLDVLQLVMPSQWKKLYASRDSIINHSNPDFCGKWRILKKLLKFWHDQGENKVLIFSHSVRLLKMLHDLFMNSSYNVKYLDGSMKYEERYIAVQEFNSDPMQFVFLISTKAGGVGLNITSANKVVVIDPNWNPSYDLQAQDRAYRIGQTRDVEVFRLVSQGTLEEIVYARQIYKQQQASIGYNATEERRYFQGVQDRKDQKGEIFGLQNLFAYEHENVVLRDIVNKTNIAESRADIKVANLEVDENDASNDHSNGIKDERVSDAASIKAEDQEDAAMSQLAAEIKGETTRSAKSKHNIQSQSSASSFPTNSFDSSTDQRPDPVQAILASAGVTYTHENSEVIGSSRVEAHLSKRAEETALDASQQMNKVFADEPRPKTFLQQRHIATDQPSITDDTITYTYRPPEDVQRRQFCSMAIWAGHTDDLSGVEEFATRVESWTQAQRREFLESFYAARRKKLEEEEEEEKEKERKEQVRSDDQRSHNMMYKKEEVSDSKTDVKQKTDRKNRNVEFDPTLPTLTLAAPHDSEANGKGGKERRKGAMEKEDEEQFHPDWRSIKHEPPCSSPSGKVTVNALEGGIAPTANDHNDNNGDDDDDDDDESDEL